MITSKLSRDMARQLLEVCGRRPRSVWRRQHGWHPNPSQMAALLEMKEVVTFSGLPQFSGSYRLI
jgi:hypothetical protein